MPAKKRRRRPSLPLSTLRCLELAGTERLKEAQKVIGRRFATPALLAQALVHSSCHVEVGGEVFIQSNEKLEQLGDKVVGLAVCRYLHKRYPQYDENFFSPIIGTSVSNVMLDICAKEAGLKHLLVTNRHSATIKDIPGWTKVWADTFEAICAALYMDGDSRAVDRFLAKSLYPRVDALLRERLNPEPKVLARDRANSLLHQRMQKDGLGSPRYEYAHNPDSSWTVRVFGKENALLGAATKAQKNHAKHLAAELALRTLEAGAPLPALQPEPPAPQEEATEHT